ncbi:MAG: 4-hydroxy-tetrahydrodipicolinate reductase [Holosporales bacterium]|jgi:4-hydroxy-tetrahydrodipicolinate reductase|nr:4-hydroxy-tetrahydrodipicolinate reductase [Holosporales bacterium]
MEKVLKIGVVGANGKMGTALRTEIQASDKFVLLGAFVRKNSQFIGKLADNSGVLFSSDLEKECEKCDVIIDFSEALSTPNVIKIAQKFEKPLVCGVTGLAKETHELFQIAEKKIPIFYAENMSFGIAAVTKAVEFFAKALDDMDIEITETHHAQKKDAPSGTALQLGKKIAKAKEWNPDEVFCLERNGAIGSRPEKQIGFSVIRGGSVTGSHTVHFLGEKEIISVTHQVISRSLFASGALKAASWLYEQKPGLYGHSDLLY